MWTLFVLVVGISIGWKFNGRISDTVDQVKEWQSKKK